LARRCGVEVLRCCYINALALPAIAAVRWWRRLTRRAGEGRRAEDRVPIRPINSMLYHSFARLACWDWCYPPAGASLLAVLRVPARRHAVPLENARRVANGVRDPRPAGIPTAST